MFWRMEWARLIGARPFRGIERNNVVLA